MTSKLPINIKDLLHQRKVEGERIEYKAGWNPDAIMRTLCAFANDFENLGGGYIVIGQDCDKDGVPVFPPVGLAERDLDRIQQELLTYCNQIQPPYFPMLTVDRVEDRNLMVLWAPGGLNRPYKVPRSVTTKKKDYKYEIREPIEVRITPEDLVVLSFPGPDRSIRMKDLQAGKAVCRRYRNRRIGEFLKELDLTEGRSTGITKILKVMQSNNSPKPMFETDEDRTYFLTRLPVHELARPDQGRLEVEKTSEKASEKTSEKILAEIRRNRDVTIAELAQMTGVTTRSVERNLKKLQDAGLVERVGPAKGGYWQAREKA